MDFKQLEQLSNQLLEGLQTVQHKVTNITDKDILSNPDFQRSKEALYQQLDNLKQATQMANDTGTK
jgi:hypothetical protein